MADVLRTRGARVIVALVVVSLFFIGLAMWAGAMTNGFFGLLRTGGIAIIFFLIVWGLAVGGALLFGWVRRGEVDGHQR